MHFICEKAILVSAISIASRTVSSKNAIPALEGIHIKAGTALALTGYNLETGITVTTPARVEEAGACVLPARLFFDIIRKLPDEPVSVQADERLQVSIRCGAVSFTIAGIDADSYPELPEVEFDNAVSLPQRALKELIGGTIFSVSDNQARPVHTGCLFEIESEGLTVVAVDGYRLALRQFRCEEPIERSMRFVAPGAALKEVEKILSDSDDPVRITLGAKHILFEIGDATLVCRVLEGEFLDWRRVLPQNNPIRLQGEVAKLTASVERVGLIVSEKLKSPVRCLFGNESADFRTVTTIGAAHDVCALEGDGGDLEIGFNCRFLLEALQNIPEGRTAIELSNGLSPIVFLPAGGGGRYAYMVLPVRLKEG